MTIISRLGIERAYRLQAVGQPRVQHAIIVCSECQAEGSFVWRSPENPTSIIHKFVSMGWDIYKTTRSRCPDCTKKRTQQKASWAKRNEKMQTQNPPLNLVKKTGTTVVEPESHVHEIAAPRRTFFLLTMTEGEAPTVKPLDGAQEMIFGDKGYLVIPQEEI